MKGLLTTSVDRKRLSVGVCSAPAMPVKKATIKNEVEVKSGRRRRAVEYIRIGLSGTSQRWTSCFRRGMLRLNIKNEKLFQLIHCKKVVQTVRIK
ncbi:50S ribosomal protein L15e domain protein [Hafnia alvei ATCC 51873]|uniref:50S ribosomal protein L15e domain protein n=1 Tax=Hafnia alvei ATCC 51873 TaxID=1002364 RepID=G9YC57_HAFAL|nr:50S ribosomal protein L15e domain protein [Hafnia alvei ATCC 51873]